MYPLSFQETSSIPSSRFLSLTLLLLKPSGFSVVTTSVLTTSFFTIRCLFYPLRHRGEGCVINIPLRIISSVDFIEFNSFPTIIVTFVVSLFSSVSILYPIGFGWFFFIRSHRSFHPFSCPISSGLSPFGFRLGFLLSS